MQVGSLSDYVSFVNQQTFTNRGKIQIIIYLCTIWELELAI